MTLALQVCNSCAHKTLVQTRINSIYMYILLRNIFEPPTFSGSQLQIWQPDHHNVFPGVLQLVQVLSHHPRSNIPEHQSKNIEGVE